MLERGAMLVAAALLLIPEIQMFGHEIGIYVNLLGGLLFIVMAAVNWQFGKASGTPDIQTPESESSSPADDQSEA